MLQRRWRRWLEQQFRPAGKQRSSGRRPVGGLGVEMLEDRMLLSANPLHGITINHTTADAFPLYASATSAAVLDSFTYFTASDGVHADPLFKTDGTAAGTTLVKDLGPNLTGAAIANLTASNGKLYFTAADDSHGNEAWISDGTAAGTQMLLQINPTHGFLIPPPGLPPPGFPSLPPNSAQPGQFTAVGSKTFFTADDGVHGQEVWVTDGTAANTHLVKDVNPGNNGPFFNSETPSELTSYKGELYFMADDGIHGNELWKSDGTESGTVLVDDLNPGPAGSTSPGFPGASNVNGAEMVVSGGTLFFAADDGSHGVELWASDGTTAGTHLVKDIYSGSSLPQPIGPPVPFGTPEFANSSDPANLTDVNGKLYFTANDGPDGFQVWTSDGTAAGTVMATHLSGPSAGASPQNLTVLGSKLFFTATTGSSVQALWTLDPATNTATQLHTLSVPISGNPNSFPPIPYIPGSGAPLLAAGNTLFFAADDGIHGRELWKTDGTVAGTQFVKDVRSGPASSDISFVTAQGGNALFVANDGSHGRELWISDGTATGTHLVKDLNTQNNDANPHDLIQVGNTVYFAANDGIHGEQLWKTDGTDKGTVMVSDINQTVTPSPYAPGEVDPAGAGINQMKAIDNLIYFVADDGVHGAQLWRSDGTTAGTRMVDAINGASPGGAAISQLTVLAHRLFFVADDGLHGREVWVSNGTAAGTHMVKDVNAQPAPFFVPPPIPYVPGGTPTATVAHGTAAQDTILPLPIPLPVPPTTATQSADPNNLTVMDGNLYFVADDGVHGRELWVTEGNAVDTHMVKDIYPGVNQNGWFGGVTANSSNPDNLTRVGHTLYFTANDGVDGTELWKTNGTAAGTVMVKDLYPGSTPLFPGGVPLPNSSNPGNLTAIGNTLYFTADDGVHGVSLFKSDASGITLLRSFHAVAGSFVAPPANLTALGNTLYFTADDGIHGDQLWKSDGTHGGTVLVKDLSPGTNPDGSPRSSFPQTLQAVNGVLLFTAGDGLHPPQVWHSDGTAAGTVAVPNLTGPPGPFNAVALRNMVLFPASDGAHGLELWDLTLPSTPARHA